MEQRLTALLSLRPLADGEVAVAIERSADGRHVTVDDTTLVLTLWHEGADVVRGRFDHPELRRGRLLPEQRHAARDGERAARQAGALDAARRERAGGARLCVRAHRARVAGALGRRAHLLDRAHRRPPEVVRDGAAAVRQRRPAPRPRAQLRHRRRRRALPPHGRLRRVVHQRLRHLRAAQRDRRAHRRRAPGRARRTLLRDHGRAVRPLRLEPRPAPHHRLPHSGILRLDPVGIPQAARSGAPACGAARR